MTVLVGCFIRPRIRDFVLADRPENPVSLTPSPSSRLNSRRSENIGFCDLHSCGCRWEPIPDGTLKSGCRTGQYAKWFDAELARRVFVTGFYCRCFDG